MVKLNDDPTKTLIEDHHESAQNVNGSIKKHLMVN